MSKSPFNPMSEEKILEYIYEDVDDTDIFALKSHDDEEDNGEKEKPAENVPVTSTAVQLTENKELLEKNQQLQLRVALLETRISELYLTAKAEMDRKDKRIQELNQEKNDILFRRRQIYPNTQLAKVNYNGGKTVNSVPKNCKPNLKTTDIMNHCPSSGAKVCFENPNLTLNSESKAYLGNVKTTNKTSNDDCSLQTSKRLHSKEAPKNVNLQDTKNKQSTYSKKEEVRIDDEEILIDVSDISDTDEKNDRKGNSLDKLHKNVKPLKSNANYKNESNNELGKTSSQKNIITYPKDRKPIQSKEIQINLTDIAKVAKEKPLVEVKAINHSKEVKANNDSKKCHQKVDHHKERHSRKKDRQSAEIKTDDSNSKRDRSKSSNNAKNLKENSANPTKPSNQCEMADKKHSKKEFEHKEAHKKHHDGRQKHSAQHDKEIEGLNKKTHKKDLEHKDVRKTHQHEREKPVLKSDGKERDRHHGSARRTARKLQSPSPSRESKNRFSNRHRNNSPSPPRHAPRKSNDIYRWRRIQKRESSSECEENKQPRSIGHSYKDWKSRRQDEGRICKINHKEKRYLPQDIDILREEVWKYNREKKCKNRDKHSDLSKVRSSSTDVSDRDDLRLYLSAGSDLSSVDDEQRMDLLEEFDYIKDLGLDVLRMGNDELKSLLEKRMKDLEKCEKYAEAVATNETSDDYFEEKSGKSGTKLNNTMVPSTDLDLEAITSDEDSDNDRLSDVDVGHLTEGESSDHFEEVEGKSAPVPQRADLCPVNATRVKLEKPITSSKVESTNMKSSEPSSVQDQILDSRTEDRTAFLTSKNDSDRLSNVDVGHLTKRERSDHIEEAGEKSASVTPRADLHPDNLPSLDLKQQVPSSTVQFTSMKSCEPSAIHDKILDGKTEVPVALSSSKSDVKAETSRNTETEEKRQHRDDYVDVVLNDTEFELNTEKVEEETTNYLNSVDSNDTTKSKNSFIHDFSMSDDEPEVECVNPKKINILDITIVRPDNGVINHKNCTVLHVQEMAQQNQLSYSYREIQEEIVTNQVTSDAGYDSIDKKCQETGPEHQNTDSGLLESASNPRKHSDQPEGAPNADKAENNLQMDSLNQSISKMQTPRKKWEKSVQIDQNKSGRCATEEPLFCNQPSLIPGQQKPSFFDSPNTYISKKIDEFTTKTAKLETEKKASEEICNERVEDKEKTPPKDTTTKKPKKTDKKKKTFKVKFFKDSPKKTSPHKTSEESDMDPKQSSKRKVIPKVKKHNKSTASQISLLINAEKEKIGVDMLTTTNSCQNVDSVETTETSEIETVLTDQNVLLPDLNASETKIPPRTPRRITPIKIGEVQSRRNRPQSDSDCSDLVTSLKRTYCSTLTDGFERPEKARKLNDSHQSPLPHMEEMLKTLETQRMCRKTIEVDSANVERQQSRNAMNENSLPVINLDTKDLPTLGPLERNIFQNMTDYLATATLETGKESTSGKTGENLNFSFYLKTNSTTTSTPLKRQPEVSLNSKVLSQSSVSSANNSSQNKKYLLAPLKRDRTKRVKCQVIVRPV